MAELLWVNTSATRDSTSDTHARHVIRAQAMRYHHSQQKRQRQQRHTDYMLQQVKQCGIPELSIDGTDKRADERLLRPDYHVGTLTSPDHDSQERASVRSSLDRDLDAPKRSGRPSAQKSPRRSDRSAKQVHVQRLLCSPSTWGRETPDPFSSPVQVSRMFGVCKVLANWMRPELSVSSAEEIIARAWEKAPNRMILSSLTLAAVAYLDAVDLQPDCSMRNVLLYKQVALREIGLRLRTSATAISDETITCLGNVIAFEVATLSPEATVHLHGLKSMLDLKGGKSSLSLVGLTMMTEPLDMLHTLIHGTQLVLTEPTTLKAQTLDRNESIRQMLSMLSGELQKIQHENSSGQCLHLTGLHDLLATAIGATSSRRTRSGTGGKKLLDLIEASNPPQPKTKATVEARSWIRIAIARAMTILYNYIVNRHDLSHPCNDTHVGWLQEAMKAGADVLNRMPLMKSWLLLIGIAASTDPTITSFFSAKLTVHLYQRGWNAETKSLFELAIRLKWDLQLFPVLNLCKPHSSSWPALSELKPQSKQALRKGGEIEGMDILANDQIFMSSLYDKDCRFTENVVSDGFAMSPMTSSARGDKSLDVAQFHTTLSWCGTSPRSLGVSEYSTKIRQKGKTLDLIKNKYTADCIGRTYVVVSSTKH